MTVENRTFIALDDIAAIEYECGHCHARHFVPVDEFQRVIYQCPNCKEELISGAHPNSSKPSDDAALHNFIDALKELRSRGLTLRLEILGEIPE
jgi:hypothetical protein